MDDKNGLKGKVFSGLFWSFGERILAQLVSFTVSVILARLLMPEEYGVVTLVLVFINIANVFVSNGFGEALIQRKNATEEDFSTIFYCSFAVSVFIYLVLFIGAPFISKFYGSAELTWVLRILSLKLPIAGFNTIQKAYVQKHMQFKKFFFATLGGTLISGFVGILMAYKGFGVWALVAQYLTNSVIDTIVLFVTISWKPKLQFSKKSASELMSYAWKLTASSLINTVYNELRSLIIGKKYSTADLSYYNKGNHIPSLAITNVDSAISTVVFPALSSANDDPNRLKQISRRAMKVSAYLVFPAMAGIIGVGEPLVRLLLTEKWLPCVPYLYMACLYWACQPVQTTNWQILKAMGRSDLTLKLEVYKKVIGFALIAVSMPFGVEAMAASNVLFAFISMIINIIPNKKLIGYSLREQFADLLPSLFASIVMGCVVYFIGQTLVINDIVLIILQVIIGVILYLVLSILLKIDSFNYVLNIVKEYAEKWRNK